MRGDSSLYRVEIFEVAPDFRPPTLERVRKIDFGTLYPQMQDDRYSWADEWRIAIYGDRILVFKANETRWAICDFRRGLATIISLNRPPVSPLHRVALAPDFEVIFRP